MYQCCRLIIALASPSKDRTPRVGPSGASQIVLNYTVESDRHGSLATDPIIIIER